MLSSNQKKLVNSLKQKKYRIEYDLFVVEGVKMLKELQESSYEIELVFGTKEWLSNNSSVDGIEVSEKELKSISYLKTPNEVLAVVRKKKGQLVDLENQFSIALEKVNDPGNLGTIIRTADWFGIKNIICSKDCVDQYNQKVLQATMGSFFRTNLVYTDLKKFFSTYHQLEVYGALLEGNNVYHKELNSKGSVLLMGNESKGISDQLTPFITEKISIPKFGRAESLNVAIATAIICSESRRGY